MSFIPVNADCFYLSLDELMLFFRSSVCPVTLSCSMREFGLVDITNTSTGEVYRMEVCSVDE